MNPENEPTPEPIRISRKEFLSYLLTVPSSIFIAGGITDFMRTFHRSAKDVANDLNPPADNLQKSFDDQSFIKELHLVISGTFALAGGYFAWLGLDWNREGYQESLQIENNQNHGS